MGYLLVPEPTPIAGDSNHSGVYWLFLKRHPIVRFQKIG